MPLRVAPVAPALESRGGWYTSGRSRTRGARTRAPDLDHRLEYLL